MGKLKEKMAFKLTLNSDGSEDQIEVTELRFLKNLEVVMNPLEGEREGNNIL